MSYQTRKKRYIYEACTATRAAASEPRCWPSTPCQGACLAKVRRQVNKQGNIIE